MQWWAAIHSCPLFACRGGLRKSRADCSAVGLYCVTITWQQILKGSRYITGAGVLLHETVERRLHILAGNAARQWHADSGKSRTFILCEKNHEGVYSNTSTSLKNPLLVRVWSMCPSVKLHLCRLLFMQYKIMWLVRIHLCMLVGMYTLIWYSSDIWANTECKAIFCCVEFS